MTKTDASITVLRTADGVRGEVSLAFVYF